MLNVIDEELFCEIVETKRADDNALTVIMVNGNEYETVVYLFDVWYELCGVRLEGGCGLTL